MRGDRRAEVAVHRTAEPVQVLQRQRLVQAELVVELRGGLRRVVVAEQREDLVALEQPDKQEAEQGRADEHHDHLEQPVDDPTGHDCRPYRSHPGVVLRPPRRLAQRRGGRRGWPGGLAGLAGEREVGAEPVQVDAGHAMAADRVVRPADHRDGGGLLVDVGVQAGEQRLQLAGVGRLVDLADQAGDVGVQRDRGVQALRRARLLERAVEDRAGQPALDGERHVEAAGREGLLKRRPGHGRHLGVDAAGLPRLGERVGDGVVQPAEVDELEVQPAELRDEGLGLRHVVRVRVGRRGAARPAERVVRACQSRRR